MTQPESTSELPSLVVTNADDLASVFTEWLENYNADPTAFQEEYDDTGEYGTDCARYLIKLLKKYER